MESIAKDPSFIVRSESPVCGGPPLARLVERPLTWREDFFVRNHGAIPDLDARPLAPVGGGPRQPSP